MSEKKKKSNIIVVVIIILLLLFVVECYTYFSDDAFSFLKSSQTEEDSSEQDSDTKTVAAERRTIKNTLSSSGQISSALDEKISLHASYYFEELLVEENQSIKEGANILKYTNGTYLTAPYDCILISHELPAEDEICTTSHYVEIQSIHTLSMTLNISETDINKVSVGDVVDITLTSSEEKVQGNITSISEIGTYSSSGSYFPSTVTFINNGNFKIGMGATCEIIVESVENVISVPKDSVQTSDSGKYVIIVNDDGSTTNQTVETGISDDDYIEIKSGITEGTKVQVQETDSSSSKSDSNFPGFGNRDGSSQGESQRPSFEGMPDMPR